MTFYKNKKYVLLALMMLCLSACVPQSGLKVEINGLNANGVEPSAPNVIVDYSQSDNIGSDQFKAALAKTVIVINGVNANDYFAYGETQATVQPKFIELYPKLFVNGKNTIEVRYSDSTPLSMSQVLSKAEFTFSKVSPRALVTEVIVNDDDTLTVKGVSQSPVGVDFVTFNSSVASLMAGEFDHELFTATLPQENSYVVVLQDDTGKRSRQIYVKRGAYVDRAVRVSVNDEVLVADALKGLTSSLPATTLTVPAAVVSQLNPLTSFDVPLLGTIEVGLTEFDSLDGGKTFVNETMTPSRTYYASRFDLGKGFVINQVKFLGDNDSKADINASLNLFDTTLYLSVGNMDSVISIRDLAVDLDLNLTMNDIGKMKMGIERMDLGLTGLSIRGLGPLNFLVTPITEFIDGLLGGVIKDMLADVLNEKVFELLQFGGMLELENLLAADLRLKRIVTADGNLQLDVQTAFAPDQLRKPALGAVSKAGVIGFDNTHMQTGTVVVRTKTVVDAEGERYTDETTTVVLDDSGKEIYSLALPSATFGSVDYAIKTQTPAPNTSGMQNIGVTLSSDMINQMLLAFHESGGTDVNLYLANGTVTVAALGVEAPKVTPGAMRVNVGMMTPLELSFSGNNESELLTDVLVPSIKLSVARLNASSKWDSLLTTSVMLSAGADLTLSTSGSFTLEVDSDDVDLVVLDAKLLNSNFGGNIDTVLNPILGLVKAPLINVVEDVAKVSLDLTEFGISDLGLSNIKLSSTGDEQQHIEASFNFSLGGLIQQMLDDKPKD